MEPGFCQAGLTSRGNMPRSRPVRPLDQSDACRVKGGEDINEVEIAPDDEGQMETESKDQ